jgi:hypothetical protein
LYTVDTVNKQGLKMLTARDLDTKPAGRFAYAAARDADRYSDECRMRYTASQRAQAETMRDIVCLAYTGSNTYINYRKTFIVIKVEKAEVRDRRMVRELDEICTERNYTKTRSAQGIAFRIV